MPERRFGAAVTSERRHLSGTEIVGSSPAWRSIMRQLEKVAPSSATVLIMGETGTG
jgi:transcriptional regulator with GAF, ATPase, and Fis domain